jgi:phage tail tube protein FII
MSYVWKIVAMDRAKNRFAEVDEGCADTQDEAELELYVHTTYWAVVHANKRWDFVGTVEQVSNH